MSRLKSFGRISVLTWALMALCFLCNQFAYCAVLHLKNGDKVEGEYAGGSKDEVRFKVGSQVLTFNISEVAAMVLDATSGVERLSDAGDSFHKQAKEALRTLKGLASVAGAGVSYQDYKPRVTDATIKINEFLDEYRDNPMPEFSHHVSEALGFFSAAADAWHAEIFKSYQQLELNPYVRKCKLWMAVAEKDAQREAELARFTRDLPVFGIKTAVKGIPYLWECAGEEIEQADALLRKEEESP